MPHVFQTIAYVQTILCDFDASAISIELEYQTLVLEIYRSVHVVLADVDISLQLWLFCSSSN